MTCNCTFWWTQPTSATCQPKKAAPVTCHDGLSRTLFSWTIPKLRLRFLAQSAAVTSHQITKCSHRRSWLVVRRLHQTAQSDAQLNTSTSSMSLARVTTTSVHCVIHDQCSQWWRFGAVGSDVGRINAVTLRRARIVLGWVTVSGFNSCCGKFISV